MELQFFWSEIVFIKNDSQATENAILATLPKISLQKTTDLSLRFRKRKKEIMIFLEENSFSSNCASAHLESICDHPVKNLSSKLSKLFARNPERTKILCVFQKKLFLSKMFVWTCAIGYWQACRNLVAKKNEKLSRTPKLLKLEFFEQTYFFHQKWFFSNGACNFDNDSKQFSPTIHRLAAQIPKTTEKTLNFSKGK